jgi:hypothetical protein
MLRGNYAVLLKCCTPGLVVLLVAILLAADTLMLVSRGVRTTGVVAHVESYTRDGGSYYRPIFSVQMPDGTTQTIAQTFASNRYRAVGREYSVLVNRAGTRVVINDFGSLWGLELAVAGGAAILLLFGAVVALRVVPQIKAKCSPPLG